MEITDLFVVNKMDLDGADRKVAEIKQMLELNINYKYESYKIEEKYAKVMQWTPDVIKVNSQTGENFTNLLDKISDHREFLEKTGVISNYYKNRIKTETLQILKHKLTEKVEELINTNEQVDEYINQVIERSLDPYSMANLIIKLLGIDK